MGATKGTNLRKSRQGKGGHKKVNAKLPFAFRYNHGAGAKTTFRVVTRMGGFVVVPLGRGPVRKGIKVTPQMSFVVGKRISQMPSGGKRLISQAEVMGNLSPNAAAKALGLQQAFFPNWEWLHLVAFSISPTHVPSLSKGSEQNIKKSGQVQQIRENLVLGTAAANTEMLTWESLIKGAVRQDPGLSVQLMASADVSDEEVTINGVSYGFTLCHRIKYHFQFRNVKTSQMTVPMIIEIDGASHDKPSSMSFEEAQEMINDALENIVTLKELPIGIRTEDLVQFK